MAASNFWCISAHIAQTILSENRNKWTNEMVKFQRKNWNNGSTQKKAPQCKRKLNTKVKTKNAKFAFLSLCCDLIWTHCFALAEPSFWISITMVFALSEAHFFFLPLANAGQFSFAIVMRYWVLTSCNDSSFFFWSVTSNSRYTNNISLVSMLVASWFRRNEKICTTNVVQRTENVKLLVNYMAQMAFSMQAFGTHSQMDCNDDCMALCIYALRQRKYSAWQTRCKDQKTTLKTVIMTKWEKCTRKIHIRMIHITVNNNCHWQSFCLKASTSWMGFFSSSVSLYICPTSSNFCV